MLSRKFDVVNNKFVEKLNIVLFVEKIDVTLSVQTNVVDGDDRW